MAENSPLRRQRGGVGGSPRKHPYERRAALSPLQSSAGNIQLNAARPVKPLSFAMAGGLSFSGGSQSLFPPNNPAPAAPGNKRRNAANFNYPIDGQENSSAQTEGSIITAASAAASTAVKPATFGVIGGSRKSASCMGFIPVNTSCTIIGSSDGGNSQNKIIPSPVLAGSARMFDKNPQQCSETISSKFPIGQGYGKAASFTHMPQGMVDVEPEDLRRLCKGDKIAKPLYHQKVVHSKTFHPNQILNNRPHGTAFSIFESPVNNNLTRIRVPASTSIDQLQVQEKQTIPQHEINVEDYLNKTQNDEHNMSFKENDNPLDYSMPKCSDEQGGGSSVTTGVVGKLQPKGLNTSFTEKFVSQLGIHSGEQNKTGESAATNSEGRVILAERFEPLFDFPEYHAEILEWWRSSERKFRPKCYYMDDQKEISHKMRSILVDWIAEVSVEYSFYEETFHLAVGYVDRFLSLMNVPRSKLQLVGVTALLIATKFEESTPLSVSDCEFVCDSAYTKDHIKRMENAILQTLQFNLVMPTAFDFAVGYCSVLKTKDNIKCLVMYLVDLSLLDGNIYMQYLPSIIATAAIALSRFTFNEPYWDKKIEELSKHKRRSITACVRNLHASFHSASSRQQTALYEKYQSNRFCSVSLMFIPEKGPWTRR